MITTPSGLDGRSISYLAAKADAADTLIAQLRDRIAVLEEENRTLVRENEQLKNASTQTRLAADHGSQDLHHVP